MVEDLLRAATSLNELGHILHDVCSCVTSHTFSILPNVESVMLKAPCVIPHVVVYAHAMISSHKRQFHGVFIS